MIQAKGEKYATHSRQVRIPQIKQNLSTHIINECDEN